MSYTFSKSSQAKLATCDARLQKLFNEVIKHYDCTILVGYRGMEAQAQAFEAGLSKKAWGQSKHNVSPSLAVDVTPFPIDWNDTEAHYYFAGFVKGVAAMMGIEIRAGLDWDGDNDLHDQTFIDAVHFELVD